MKKAYNTVWMTPLLIFFGLLIGFFILEGLLLKFNGSPVPAPDIPRQPVVEGDGEPLTYVVMGDSTAIGQGGEYEKGIAIESMHHLAASNKVTMINTGVSGARAKDVSTTQLDDAIKAKPDVVLIIVGSNDVTHLTSIASMKQSLGDTISGLRRANCNIKIILTGSAQMGAVPRLPQPIRYLAEQRVKTVNAMFHSLVNENQLTFSPIADKTGDTFKKDRSLFAADKFHPNTKGYQVWVPVITTSLDEALESQPSHCE